MHEVMYSLHTESGINKPNTYIFDAFFIQNGFKQGDELLPLTFSLGKQN